MSEHPGRLSGKVGIVLGGGQQRGETIGNGRAASVLFAREGARLVVVDLVLESAQETADMIKTEGGDAIAMAGDWTSAADCQAVAKACVERWGRIDLLQNNVGGAVAAGDAPAALVSEAAFDQVMNFNLMGAILSCQAVLPTMAAQRQGSIVNISSGAAVAGVIGITAGYKLSKMALNGLGEMLALQHARDGVRVNTVMPGLIDTPIAIEAYVNMTGKTREQVRADRNGKVPLRGRMGTAWDIAEASLFLHSDAANFITGVVLPVDGGQTLRRG